MRKFLPLLGLLVCAIPSHAQSTISAVVSGSCASSPTTCTTSSTLNIASSDTVVVFVQTSNADCNDTVTDSGSVFTFTVQACAATGNSGAMEMFVGTATGAAGCGGTNSTISAPNGTASFEILIGSGGATSGSCTITMPAANTSWTCDANTVGATTTSYFVAKQTGVISTTSVVLQEFNDVAVAVAFATSDTIRVKCSAN